MALRNGGHNGAGAADRVDDRVGHQGAAAGEQRRTRSSSISPPMLSKTASTPSGASSRTRAARSGSA